MQFAQSRIRVQRNPFSCLDPAHWASAQTQTAQRIRNADPWHVYACMSRIAPTNPTRSLAQPVVRAGCGDGNRGRLHHYAMFPGFRANREVEQTHGTFFGGPAPRNREDTGDA